MEKYKSLYVLDSETRHSIHALDERLHKAMQTLLVGIEMLQGASKGTAAELLVDGVVSASEEVEEYLSLYRYTVAQDLLPRLTSGNHFRHKHN